MARGGHLLTTLDGTPGPSEAATAVSTPSYRQQVSGGLATRPRSPARTVGTVGTVVTVPRKPAHRRPPETPWPSLLCLLFIVLGSGVRLRQYGARRSLWLDEASITDNLINRHTAGLLRPLAHHQGAPLGWLLSEKLNIHLLGRNEYGLRLTSIVTGILTLFLVWWLARRTLPKWLVPLAVAAAAVSPQLIRYGSETKQYGSDAFAVTFVVALAVTISQLKPSAVSWRTAANWAVVGSLAVVFSHPAIVATASCCLVMLVRRWFGGHRKAFWRLAAASAAIGAVVLVLYELVLKGLSDDGALKDYWKSGSPPKPLAFGSLLRWAGRTLVAYTHDPLHLGPTLLVGILFVAGIAALARRDRTVCLLLIAPLALQLLVSALGIFPLSGRLVLGYVPLILVVLAGAANLLAGLRWARLGSLAIGGLVVVPLVPNAIEATRLAANPLRFEEIRPVLQAVQRDYEPGQLLYMHVPALPAFQIYQDMGIHLKSNGKMYTVRRPYCQDDELLRRLNAIGTQVWFISAHQLGTAPHEADQIRDRLRAEGTVLRDITAPGAEAILVQIRGSLDQLTPGVPGNCLQVIPHR